MPSFASFLSTIHRYDLFRLFVDGSKHHPEDGWKRFEAREPGCMSAFFNALAFAINNQNSKITSELILKIHEMATSNVTGEMVHFQSKKGFRHTHNETGQKINPTGFDVPKNRATRAGFNEFIEIYNDTRKRLNYPPHVNYNNIEYDYLDYLNYSAPYDSSTNIKKEVENIIDHYYSDIKKAANYDEKLLAIVNCARRFELLHPFEDANGRTFVNIVLNLLLVQNGFPPAIFYEPNVFDLYAGVELVEIVKDGMSHTLFLMQNPDKPLFGYNSNFMDPTDKKDLEEVTQPLLDLLRPYDENHVPFIDDKDLSNYLESTYHHEIDLHRAIVLGDMNKIVSLATKEQINVIGPDYTSPLYRGRSPLHVAILVGNHAAAEYLIKTFPELVYQTDETGNDALHYAIVANNQSLVNQILSLSPVDGQDFKALFTAARSGHLEIFTKIYSYYDPAKIDYESIFSIAAEANNEDVLNFLFSNGLVSKTLAKEYLNDGTNIERILHSKQTEVFKKIWRYAFDQFKPDHSQFWNMTMTAVRNGLPEIALFVIESTANSNITNGIIGACIHHNGRNDEDCLPLFYHITARNIFEVPIYRLQHLSEAISNGKLKLANAIFNMSYDSTLLNVDNVASTLITELDLLDELKMSKDKQLRNTVLSFFINKTVELSRTDPMGALSAINEIEQKLISKNNNKLKQFVSKFGFYNNTSSLDTSTQRTLARAKLEIENQMQKHFEDNKKSFFSESEMQLRQNLAWEIHNYVSSLKSNNNNVEQVEFESNRYLVLKHGIINSSVSVAEQLVTFRDTSPQGSKNISSDEFIDKLLESIQQIRKTA